MANEVSFFHAMRKMSIEKEIRETEMIIQVFDWSEEQWQKEPGVEYIDYYYEKKNKLEELRKSLEECEADLQAAIASRK